MKYSAVEASIEPVQTSVTHSHIDESCFSLKLSACGLSNFIAVSTKARWPILVEFALEVPGTCTQTELWIMFYGLGFYISVRTFNSQRCLLQKFAVFKIANQLFPSPITNIEKTELNISKS